ncbi:MAG: chorismate-binding protein, partial [Bacteroidetes bacterium]|nr:chorismate-binding protein [Bacteroidota bacterium]
MKIRIDDLEQFKQKALQWASSFDVFCCLDSNNFSDKYSKFEFLLAVGVKTELAVQPGNSFDQLEQFRAQNAGWITGFLTYDLKNEVEKLQSGNPDYLGFPELYFFSPVHLILVKSNEAEFISGIAEQVADEILSQELWDSHLQNDLKLQSRFSRREYVNAVGQIKQHISRGDIYVTNFCQEFFAKNTAIDPLAAFLALSRISPNPFSTFFK